MLNTNQRLQRYLRTKGVEVIEIRKQLKETRVIVHPMTEDAKQYLENNRLFIKTGQITYSLYQ